MKALRITRHPSTRRKARRFKEEFLRQHFGKPRQYKMLEGKPWPSIGVYYKSNSNVVGIGYGVKETASGIEAKETLRIYVRKKFPLNEIPFRKRIPPHINGLQTDVIEIGTIKPAQRPAIGGCSGGYASCAGTLGSLVTGNSTGNNFILSCLHVFADVTNPTQGELIYEPSIKDGGGLPIGQLYAWRNFLDGAGNLVDCAIASINKPGDFASGLRGLGSINPNPSVASVLQTVAKSGRDAPGVTFGSITDIDADVPVQYPENSQAEYGFVQQIAIKGSGNPFAGNGDSGSIVVDKASLQPVGLLFAVGNDGSGNFVAFANPINLVLGELNISF